MLDTLLGGADFDAWVAVHGGARISPRFRLAPFATSLRKFGQAVDSLGEIQRGVPLSVADATQRARDLRAMALVEDSPKTPSGAALTPLGATTWSRWNELAVANGRDELELVRAVVVLEAASAVSEPTYREFLTRWMELRECAAESVWLGSPWATILATYLNEDVEGFNPWKIICRGDVQEHPELIAREAWAGWAQGRPALERILDRIDDRNIIGHHAFCTALELMRRQQDDPHSVVEGLVIWSMYVG